jgi:hypothetical protein
VLGWLLEAWKAYAHRASSYQSNVLLTLVYLVILGPAALLARLLGARLLDLDDRPGSTWLVRRDITRDLQTLVGLRRQF